LYLLRIICCICICCICICICIIYRLFVATRVLQALQQLSKAPAPDQHSKARLLFVLKLLTMLFTTLDTARREDDQPESEASPAVDPGSGEGYFVFSI
jgi:hypothetical protein